jgi:predicted O-methyltransferase YrrM
MIAGSDFAEKVRPLYVPTMGTERIAPLLYALTRFSRAENVLEIGAGYTTLFLLKALADNAADRARESAALAQRSPETEGAPRFDEAFSAKLRGEPPEGAPLLLPSYYERPYRPLLHTIDLLSHPKTSAGEVERVATELGLRPNLRFHAGDFRDYAPALAKEGLRFDLLWLDAGGYQNYMTLLRDYWKLISPDGGLLLIHSTMTNLEGQLFLKKMKLDQATRAFADYELVSLVEPHKRKQNSVTLIRITSESPDRIYTRRP